MNAKITLTIPIDEVESFIKNVISLQQAKLDMAVKRLAQAQNYNQNTLELINESRTLMMQVDTTLTDCYDTLESLQKHSKRPPLEGEDVIKS